ncbi:hypothetical protein BVRB_6g148490 [Beta vulgaris subsp. vulgaris]|nr:hypothetical protein BVRB_6g148490 [Beta vulgaris subsp. vulgaris]
MSCFSCTYWFLNQAPTSSIHGITKEIGYCSCECE